MMDDILHNITEFADKAHGDQMRKYSPDRYIVHPVRVMQLCRQYTDSLPVLAAALLHDVLEDTPVKACQLETFLRTQMTTADAAKTVALVEELTDVYTRAGYPQWNRYKRKRMDLERMVDNSAEAHTIKYADVLDNSMEIAAADPDFGKRFLQECKEILDACKKGHAGLRNRAKKVVEDALNSIKE